MSKREPDKGESGADFMHNAIKLEQEIMELLLRDFGIKKRVYNHIKNVRMDEESSKRLDEIMYRLDPEGNERDEIEEIINKSIYSEKEIGKYPEWLIDYFRKTILHGVEAMMIALYLGNAIFITNEDEYQKRREYWNTVLGCCKHLAGRLDRIRKTLPVDANKYERYLNRIWREISMIKRLKTADNKVINKIRKREGKDPVPGHTGTRR